MRQVETESRAYNTGSVTPDFVSFSNCLARGALPRLAGDPPAMGQAADLDIFSGISEIQSRISECSLGLRIRHEHRSLDAKRIRFGHR